MITGRIVTTEGDDTVYDYCGCLYPEGVTGADSMFFFNRDAIEQVYFIGFQDAQEIQFKTEFLDKLGKVEVVNGELTEVEPGEPIEGEEDEDGSDGNNDNE